MFAPALSLFTNASKAACCFLTFKEGLDLLFHFAIQFRDLRALVFEHLNDMKTEIRFHDRTDGIFLLRKCRIFKRFDHLPAGEGSEVSSILPCSGSRNSSLRDRQNPHRRQAVFLSSSALVFFSALILSVSPVLWLPGDAGHERIPAS